LLLRLFGQPLRAAAAAASMHTKIVVVVGTTGVGKTKLGVDLAQHFSGEVINVDVMQMYKGLEVATAKVTEAERQGVPHHLMSFLEPHETFSPHAFRKLADDKIREISSRGKMPIIVGGTMYYIQGLLWDHLIGHGKDSRSPRATEEATEAAVDEHKNIVDGEVATSSSSLSSSSSTSLWEKLQTVDPEMASELHPNNIRKIARSLEIYNTSGGVTHTELLRQQKESGGGIASLEKSRYPNACILWCRCDKDVLKERLDNRVIDMMSNGLPEEIVELQASAMTASHSSSAVMPYDPTRGVYQSIGFKEFQEYLEKVRLNEDNEDMGGGESGGERQKTQTNSNVELAAALERGVEQLKISTHRYARKQLAWIRNRWVANDIPVHVLDTTVIKQWEINVNQIAQSVVRASFGVLGCVGSERSDRDRRIKQECRDESVRMQRMHAEQQHINQQKSNKKRKYREALRIRKREENLKRRAAAEQEPTLQ